MNLQFKLPIEFKEKWITALRSGEFKQDHGYLKTDQGHCCLGVAVEVCGNGFQQLEYEIHYDDRKFYKTLFGSNCHLDRKDIPGAAYDALHQRGSLNSAIGDCEIQDYLSVLNDNDETFNTIADWIEANL